MPNHAGRTPRRGAKTPAHGNRSRSGARAPRIQPRELGFLSRVFLKGLLAVLPITITVSLLVWLGTALEFGLGRAFRFVLPVSWYVPGLGLLLGIIAIFLIGLLLQAWLIRRVWASIESMLERIPGVSFIYSATKQITGYLSGSATEQAKQVVMVSLGNPPIELVGFVTRDDFADLPKGIGSTDSVAVYLPMSYQVGGFTVIVPRSQTRVIDMRFEEALRFTLTAGVAEPPEEEPTEGKEKATS